MALARKNGKERSLAPSPLKPPPNSVHVPSLPHLGVTRFPLRQNLKSLSLAQLQHSFPRRRGHIWNLAGSNPRGKSLDRDSNRPAATVGFACNVCAPLALLRNCKSALHISPSIKNSQKKLRSLDCSVAVGRYIMVGFIGPTLRYCHAFQKAHSASRLLPLARTFAL